MISCNVKSKILFIIPIVIGVRSISGNINNEKLRELGNEVQSFDRNINDEKLRELRKEVHSFDRNTPTEKIVVTLDILSGLAESQYSKKLRKIEPKQPAVVANLEKDYQKIQTRQQYLQWIERKKDLIKLDHESYMQDKEYSKKSREVSKSYYVCWKDMNPTLCKFDLAIERQRDNPEKMKEIQNDRATYIEHIQDMSRKLIEECDQDYQEMLMQVLNAVDQVLEANREIQPEEVERLIRPLQKLDRKSQGEEDMGVVGEQGVVDRAGTVGIIGISVPDVQQLGSEVTKMPDVQQLREDVTKRGSNNKKRGVQFNKLGKRILERQENVESAENLGTNTKNIKLPRTVFPPDKVSTKKQQDTKNQRDNQDNQRIKLPSINPYRNNALLLPNPKRAKHSAKLPPLPNYPTYVVLLPPVRLL